MFIHANMINTAVVCCVAEDVNQFWLSKMLLVEIGFWSKINAEFLTNPQIENELRMYNELIKSGQIIHVYT